jgi:hypothetical protein
MFGSQFIRFLEKALQAAEFGKAAWGPMSIGEKVSVALALSRADWLRTMGYTIPEAIDRAGSWAALVPQVARELDERRGPHWRGFK